MITKFKLFENLNAPKKGYYAMVSEVQLKDKVFTDHIGIIKKVHNDDEIFVEFEEEPNTWIEFLPFEVLAWGKTKDDVKKIVIQDRFDL